MDLVENEDEEILQHPHGQAEEYEDGEETKEEAGLVETTKPRYSHQIIEIGEIHKDEDDRESNGLLSHAPIKVGDVIKSINNQKCTNLDETQQLLKETQGSIALIIETPRGNPALVQVTVTKPTIDTMVGIGFFNIMRRYATSLLEINHISPNGLLSHSLLNQGYLVLAINGNPCSHLKAEEAADLIKKVKKLALSYFLFTASAIATKTGPDISTVSARL